MMSTRTYSRAHAAYAAHSVSARSASARSTITKPPRRPRDTQLIRVIEGNYGNIEFWKRDGKAYVVKVTNSEVRANVSECIVMSLKHPNIIPYLDICGRTDVDGMKITMPAYHSDLNTITGGVTYPIVMIAHDLLSAFAYLHYFGISHNDLKPSNVFVNLVDGEVLRVVLSDFGLAIIFGTGVSAVQTDAYRDPNIILGDSLNLNGSVDMWSFGIMMIELMTGQRVFDSKTFTADHNNAISCIMVSWFYRKYLPWYKVFEAADCPKDFVNAAQWLMNTQPSYLIKHLNNITPEEVQERVTGYIMKAVSPVSFELYASSGLIDIICGCLIPKSELRISASDALGILELRNYDFINGYIKKRVEKGCYDNCSDRTSVSTSDSTSVSTSVASTRYRNSGSRSAAIPTTNFMIDAFTHDAATLTSLLIKYGYVAPNKLHKIPQSVLIHASWLLARMPRYSQDDIATIMSIVSILYIDSSSDILSHFRKYTTDARIYSLMSLFGFNLFGVPKHLERSTYSAKSQVIDPIAHFNQFGTFDALFEVKSPISFKDLFDPFMSPSPQVGSQKRVPRECSLSDQPLSEMQVVVPAAMPAALPTITAMSSSIKTTMNPTAMPFFPTVASRPLVSHYPPVPSYRSSHSIPS